MSSTDIRAMTSGLGWVTEALFPDRRLELSLDATPKSNRTAGQTVSFAVVPSLRNPRFLLPLGSRRAAVASTLAYNGLRPARVRLQRLLVALLAGTGTTGLAGMPVLNATVPAGVDPRELLLTEHLGELFGCRLHAAIGIRPADPHHKPTLQLFDEQGQARGYAKVGWNPATRAMVRAEATALGRPMTAGDGRPVTPRLLHALQWRGRTVTVVEPMPRGVRRLRRPDVPQAAAILAVARNGRAAARPQPLAGSAFLAGLVERSGDADSPIRAAVDALGRRDGATEVEFGEWHGDWVPWNLAAHRGELFAWDWENRGSDVPVGLDLAHQAFQTALSVHRLTARDAAAQMTVALDRHGADLGLGPAQRRLVGDAYLIELWLRTAELAAQGAGWNARLHPSLLRILDERLRIRKAAAA